MSRPSARALLALLVLGVAAACSPSGAWRSVVTLGGLVGSGEPDVQWFRFYPRPMRSSGEVAILCHRERATWVRGIRRAGSVVWLTARHEKWHFPRCIEVLPGTYELEVHYFQRDHEDTSDQSVTRQTESTVPSVAEWRAEAGRVYRLSAVFEPLRPSAGPAPRRHIPRARSLGTTWWELEESEWRVVIVQLAERDLDGDPVLEQRSAWRGYDDR